MMKLRVGNESFDCLIYVELMMMMIKSVEKIYFALINVLLSNQPSHLQKFRLT